MTHKPDAVDAEQADFDALLREVVKDEILKDARPTLESLKALHADRSLLVLALSQAIQSLTELDALRREVEAGKPKWIPVSERLPTKDGLYLITDTDTLEIEIAWCENGRFGFFPNKGMRIRFEALDHASAWQPLPEPYTEGE